MGRPTLNVLSLCSGIGGLDLAVRRVITSTRTVCYVEREAFACAVLAQAMGRGTLDSAPIWSDVATFDGRPWRAVVDIVIGGYPCQPFSQAGTRRGQVDPRHIWPHCARILRETDAPLAFFENVSGHLSLGGREVIKELQGMGYEVASLLCRASDVGAPHRRERLFILAYSNSPRREARCSFLTKDGPMPSSRRASVVGDTDSSRCEGTRCPEPTRHTFPPPPSDAEGWERWVANGGPEPIVRVGAARIPTLLDELAALGNAVVPEQGALALRLLIAEMARRVTRLTQTEIDGRADAQVART